MVPYSVPKKVRYLMSLKEHEELNRKVKEILKTLEKAWLLVQY